MSCRIASYGATDIGLSRRVNQDSFLADDTLGLYVVADGMGGHSGGEVASRMAVDVIRSFVRLNRHGDGGSWPYGILPELSYGGNVLRTAIMLANAGVYEEAGKRPELAGMGTTIVAAVIENDLLTVGSAGDSRVYHMRGDRIRQLTTDDSWVQSALERGVLRPDELRNHAMRNVITKAVGTNPEIEPRILEEPLQPGDYCLLCSDGLHGLVGDPEILETVRAAGDDLAKAVTDLIAAANAAGGKDNITAVLLSCRR